MPFVKQTLRPQIEVRNIFIGRTNELHFFIEHMLKPEVPTYNVVSVWGDAAVGKSTLLTRLRDEAHTADFKDWCLTVLMDVQQMTPARIMEHCAAQLRLAGSPLPAFENMLARYKETVQEQQSEQEVARAIFCPKKPGFYSKYAVPLLANLEGADRTTLAVALKLRKRKR